MSIINLLPKVNARNRDEQRAQRYREFLRSKARMGGELFGPIPAGHRREFFCLDEHTWVWHEEWADATGTHAVTTRYDVRPQGILKTQGSSSYQLVTGSELRNLYRAARLYRDKVYAEAMALQAQ